MKLPDRYRLSPTWLYTVLAAVGAVVIAGAVMLGGAVSRANAQDVLDRTLSYMKRQCDNYDNVIDADEVKSLMRLTEQADAIGNILSAGASSEMADFLDSYGSSQRLSGIFVLDGQLQPVHCYDTAKAAWAKWAEVLRREAVRSVLDHPEKIYAERLELDGETYDIAVTARRDAAGLIVCCHLQERDTLDEHSTSVRALLAGYETILNGTLYITDGKNVIGTNAPGSYDAETDEIEAIGRLKGSGKHDRLVHVEVDGQSFYGGRSGYREYDLYVLFPQKSVYAVRRDIVLPVVGVYGLLILLLVVLHDRTRRAHEVELDSEHETIRAISRICSSSILIDLAADTLEFLQRPQFYEGIPTDGSALQVLDKLIDCFVAEGYREEYRRFADVETLAERMDDKRYLDFTYLAASGEWFEDIIVIKERSADGKVLSFILMTLDVNDQKQKELQYQEQLELFARRERQANLAKTDFLRRMSHDIRTPINIIIGMLEIASRHPDDPDKLERCRHMARDAAGQLLELVNDVLTLNKLEADENTTERTNFSLPEETRSIYAVAEIQAQARGLTLPPPDVQIVHEWFFGRPLYLRQIMLNILGNAVKYTPPGGRVDYSLRETPIDDERSEISFVCADTGIGMSREFQQRMFEPFAQESGEQCTTQDGVGLGLSVVRKLVDRLGGQIEVQSEKGKGTRFSVTLPLHIGHAPAAEAALPDAQPSLAGLHLLVAEDNDLGREIAVQLLSDSGASVTEAEDGEQALSLFSAAPEGAFDAILMDVQMPRMDGMTAAQRIRALPRADAKTVPILAITANIFPEDMQKYRDAGMDDMLPKPLDAQAMLHILAERCQKKGADAR